MTLTEIQDKLAKEMGYCSLEDYLNEPINNGSFYTVERILICINELSIRVQQEQQKLIAENARLQVKLSSENEAQIFEKYGNDDGFIEVNRELIINENNIIR